MIAFAFTPCNILLHCFYLNAHLVIPIEAGGQDQVALNHLKLLIRHLLHHLANFVYCKNVIFTITIVVIVLESLREHLFECHIQSSSCHACYGLFFFDLI